LIGLVNLIKRQPTSLLYFIYKIYKYFNLLSLDVAFGAAILSGSLNYYFNHYWSFIFSVSLGLAVWIIYTLDHILDANKHEKEPIIERHKFHKKHTKSLLFLQIIVIIIEIFCVINLPQTTIIYGLTLLIFVMGYFVIVFLFKSFYLKEVTVAIVYTCGIFLGPISVYELPIGLYVINFFVQILFLALINLIIFSWVEFDLDHQDGHMSIAIKLGKNKTKKLIGFLISFLMAWQLISLLWLDFELTQISYTIMTITLSLIYFAPNALSKNDRYRWLGDIIFFIPGIQLLF
jgi:hypothetical protein